MKTDPISQDQFSHYNIVLKRAQEIAEFWHKNAYQDGGSGAFADRISISNGKIIFYRQAHTSGIHYYTPSREEVNSKYLFDDSELEKDAALELKKKIDQWEARVKSDFEKEQELKNDPKIIEWERIKQSKPMGSFDNLYFGSPMVYNG